MVTPFRVFEIDNVTNSFVALRPEATKPEQIL